MTTTVATMAAVTALALVAFVGCGAQAEKPPLTPDGPEMTAPIGDDAGAAYNPPTPPVETPMSPPMGKAGGSESQTTIGR